MDAILSVVGVQMTQPMHVAIMWHKILATDSMRRFSSSTEILVEHCTYRHVSHVGSVV